MEDDNVKDNNIKNNYDIWDNTSTWIDGGWLGISLCINSDMVVCIGDSSWAWLTRKLLESDINLDVIDLSKTCIDKCISRFGDDIDNYYVGNGAAVFVCIRWSCWCNMEFNCIR